MTVTWPGSAPSPPLPGLQRRILTYAGSRRMRTPDGIDIWPVPDLLEALQSDRLW